MRDAILPDLTTVIPVFIKNDSDWMQLRRVLVSIRNQSLLPKSVVLTDDSPQEFSNILRFFLSEFIDLDIELSKNLGTRGISSNSNNGIKSVRTRYVHVLHQDDWLVDKNAYRDASRLLERNANQFILLGRQTAAGFVNPKFDITALVGNNQFGSPSGVIFPLSTEILFDPELKMLCDVDFVYQLFLLLGPPLILNGAVVENGFSEDQAQRLITREELVNELKLILEKHDISRFRVFVSAFRRRPSTETFAILDSLKSSSDSYLKSWFFQLSMRILSLFIKLASFMKMKATF